MMPGTKIGGSKANTTIIELLGPEEAHRWRQEIGALGGKAKTDKLKGFAAMDTEKVAAAGRLGGSRSRKKKKDL